MKLKNFKFSHFLPNFIISFAYPLARLLTGKEKAVVAFLDALTVIGLLNVLFGIINNLYLHGDFDISRYFMQKKLNKSNVPFDKFIADEKAKEKDSFNYPLLIGLLFLIISLVGAELLI